MSVVESCFDDGIREDTVRWITEVVRRSGADQVCVLFGLGVMAIAGLSACLDGGGCAESQSPNRASVGEAEERNVEPTDQSRAEVGTDDGTTREIDTRRADVHRSTRSPSDVRDGRVEFCIEPATEGVGKGAQMNLKGGITGSSGGAERRTVDEVGNEDGFVVRIGDRDAVRVNSERGAAVDGLAAGRTYRIQISVPSGRGHSSFEFEPTTGETPCLRYKGFYDSFWVDNNWDHCGPCPRSNSE